MNKLPISPTHKDLRRYSSVRLKKKRMLKKFGKNPNHYIPEFIAKEYMIKLMCQPMLVSCQHRTDEPEILYKGD